MPRSVVLRQYRKSNPSLFGSSRSSCVAFNPCVIYFRLNDSMIGCESRLHQFMQKGRSTALPGVLALCSVQSSFSCQRNQILACIKWYLSLHCAQTRLLADPWAMQRRCGERHKRKLAAVNEHSSRIAQSKIGHEILFEDYSKASDVNLRTRRNRTLAICVCLLA